MSNLNVYVERIENHLDLLHYYTDDIVISLMNTKEVKTKEEYISLIQEVTKDASIKIDRVSIYENNTKGVSMITILGEKHLKLVTFYEFEKNDIDELKIKKIDDYWFSIF